MVQTINCFPLQMQRHDLADHMQDFTQMHMRYMAEMLRGLILNGITSKSLCTIAPPVSYEDQGAAASVSACSGPRGAVSCSSNCAPCQPNKEMQCLREMDKRLVQQDHQLRYLTILKDTQVKEVTSKSTVVFSYFPVDSVALAVHYLIR